MITIGTIALFLACICFILAACNVPRANWLPIGLALWSGSILIGGMGLLR